MDMPLVLLGCGGVGRQLLQHIISCRSFFSAERIYLRVVGVCDSSTFVVASDIANEKLDDQILSEICRVKSKGQPLSSCDHLGNCVVHNGPEISEQLMIIAGELSDLVIVDCTASSETVEMLCHAVDIGRCVVLANKKPLTSTMENYQKLMSNPRRVRYESTVGAGLPIISSISRIKSSGDPLYRLIGSLSGTLGYVMSEVEEGKSLSDVVVSAKTLGYTEPDPRDDLSGMDVARKGLILARLLGMPMNMEDIQVESLYPHEMGPAFMSVEDFMSKGLVSLNCSIREKVENAAKHGNVLRYVCLIENYRCEIGLKEVPASSALGRLKGSDNAVELFSRCYEKRPLVIQGAGAGNDTTAAGVLADIVELCKMLLEVNLMSHQLRVELLTDHYSRT